MEIKYPIWCEETGVPDVFVVYWGDGPYEWTICHGRNYLVSIEVK